MSDLCPHGHRYEDCCWQGRAPTIPPKHGEPGHEWNETACAWCNWQARTAADIFLRAFGAATPEQREPDSGEALKAPKSAPGTE